MNLYRTSLWLNGLCLLLIFALVLWAKASGLSAKELFLHPESYPHITIASLTRLFQILCAVPPTLCLFTYSLLHASSAKASTRFILASALFTGGFLLNEIYRIHIHLSATGIGKPIVITVYAIFLALYIFSFRKQLPRTPYPILLFGVGILAVGICIDSLQLPDQDLTNFLEGVPKVLSEANICLYFWCVCRQAIQQQALLNRV
jgi:uncharacterized membrane protein YozB (DUF420 family)